jgi:cell division protein FtsW
VTLAFRRLISFLAPSAEAWSFEARMLRWITFLWLGLGLLILFSASYHTGLADSNDGLFYFKRQLLGIAAGLVAFQAFTRLPLRKSLAIAPIGFLICVLLIFATRIPGLGTQTLGATRSISIGGLQLQASELLKPFLVLQSAWVFSQWRRFPTKTKLTWLGIFVVTLLGILLQPNLSTTILCGTTLWLIALAAGLPYMHLSVAALGGLGAGLISTQVNRYQWTRITSFLNPWSDAQGNGYQLIQSLLAVGSGGIWGVGFGHSQQKLAYLPIQHTDFIFAIFAEEFGLMGGIFLLSLLTAYGAIAVRVALKVTNPLHRLIAIGATVLMLAQALINMGVAIGALPTTGLPFPLISYGSNSMIASLAIAGLLIRVAREGSEASIIPLSASEGNLSLLSEPQSSKKRPERPSDPGANVSSSLFGLTENGSDRPVSLAKAAARRRQMVNQRRQKNQTGHSPAAKRPPRSTR